jgi:hypothetical protein
VPTRQPSRVDRLAGLTLFQPAAYLRYRQRGAAAVRAYQQRHGHLPPALTTVDGSASTYAAWLRYQTAADGRSFTLDYSSDGFHGVRYQSRPGRWVED